MLGAGIILGAAWLALAGRGLWFDELFALHGASQGWQQMVAFLRLHDAHPPLYTALLKVWIAAFGASEWSLRAPSVLAGMATVAGVWTLARETVGKPAADVAVLSLVLSPLFLEASVDATRYALLGAFYVWAAREAYHLARTPSWPAWRLVLLAGLMLYTHYLGLVFLGSLACFGASGRTRYRTLGLLLAAVLFLAPWLPALWFHLGGGRLAPPWRPPFDGTLPLSVLHALGFGGRVLGTDSYHLGSSAPVVVQLALAFPVAVLWVVAWTGLRKVDRGVARLVVCCVAVPALALLALSAWSGKTVAYPRYLTPVAPFVAVCLGGPACSGAEWRAPLRKVAAAAAGSVLVLSLISIGILAWNPTAGAGDRKALAQALGPRLRVGDALLVYPQWEFLGLDYYLPWVRGQYVVLPSVWTEEGTKALRDSVRQVSAIRRVWVVQGSPISRDHFGALYRQLAATHRVRYARDFDGVRLTLFLRR